MQDHLQRLWEDVLNVWREARSRDGPSESLAGNRGVIYYLSSLALGSDFRTWSVMFLGNPSLCIANWSPNAVYSDSLNIPPVCPFLPISTASTLVQASSSLTRIIVITSVCLCIHPSIHHLSSIQLYWVSAICRVLARPWDTRLNTIKYLPSRAHYLMVFNNWFPLPASPVPTFFPVCWVFFWKHTFDYALPPMKTL